MLLEDGKTQTRGWNAARSDGKMRTRGCKTLKQLLGKTRNAARRRRNANSCSQDLYALLEDFVVAEWHLPDSTLRSCWNITRDHLARLVWSNPEFFAYYNLLTYLLTSLHFLNSLHVYTRGILGCLLGFWPWGQNPAGAKSSRPQVSMVYRLIKHLICW